MYYEKMRLQCHLQVDGYLFKNFPSAPVNACNEDSPCIHMCIKRSYIVLVRRERENKDFG